MGFHSNVRCRRKHVIASIIAAASSLLFAPAQYAQVPSPRVHTSKAQPEKKNAAESSTSVASAQTAELTAADLSSFLDGLVPLQIERADVAGAVVAVVKNGKLLFAKGYGYSDVEKKIPVSPENTLFRPGSISKLFTWTSVMQQVELGKLDLDRDVNDYLDFKIPPAFGKPITLRDIMTHRSGFEETVKDLFVGSEKELMPLSRYLPTHLPARIFPPGTTPAYSNYASTLAAYIVERVSGQPFNEYVEEHIFRPLEMDHAAFRQPLPDALKPVMSDGYQLASGGAKGFEYIEAAPAGALSASAESITHFMIAHLQNGRYGDVQILKPETAVQMHQRQPGWPAAMNAMCLGFYEESRNGQRIIGHGGDTQWFHSDLHLLLDANVGFFVSYNSAGRPQDVSPRSVLFDKFMDRYFPEQPANEPTLSTAARDARSVAGRYEISRRFETSFVALSTLFSEAKVTVDSKDNTILLAGVKGLNGQTVHFREVGPLVFRKVDGHSKIAFVRDASGKRVMYIDFPAIVFQKVRPLNGAIFNYLVIGFSLAVIALTLLLWPVAAILRKHYDKPLVLSPAARHLRNLVHGVCVLVVVFVIYFVLLADKLETSVGMLGAHGDLLLHILQVIGLICGVGALVAIAGAAKSWSDSTQWRWYKIWNTLLAAACVGFFWFLYHWHLLNFSLNY